VTQRPRKRSRRGWYFLLGVLALYGLTLIIAPSTATSALGSAARTLYRLIPVLGLIFALLLLLDLVVKPERVRRHLGARSGPSGWLLAIAGGVLSVGPIYAWYELLRELWSQGMRTAFLIAFLYSRAIKLPLLPLMIHYFGMAYTLVLTGYILAFTMVNALIAERLLDGPRQP
jgi:hypothetical protein